MTPEGKVKASIKKVLDRHGVYYFMPVQMGIGAAGVDFHCVVGIPFLMSGLWRKFPIAFFIEAKEKGKLPTRRQEDFLNQRETKQNCRTFVISDEESLQPLIDWMENIEIQNEHARANRYASSYVHVPT